MEYSIRELSELAGVSARTLRYYDEIGLLRPAYTTEAGYRYYGERELAILQQILFYRERGFDLKSIQRIVWQNDFDIMNALEEHLLELEKQKEHVDSLIRTVKQTIASRKGECKMSDQEKFRVFKENLVKENEKKYGEEVRQKYGDEEMDASGRKMMNMTEEEWSLYQQLGEQILAKLKENVLAGTLPESEAAREIVSLHKDWLSRSWKKYSAEAHKGVAALYTCDERFKAYYDRETEGCAAFLTAAVEYWADRIE